MKTFHISDLLSATTGRIASPMAAANHAHIDPVEELEQMTGRALTIGEIISGIHGYGDRPVRFGFAGCWPEDIISYRGRYSCPAITHSDGRYDNSKQPPTAIELRDRLRWAVECGVYEAWKGGEYRYGYGDVLFVANEGICSPTVIIGVKYDGLSVILETAYYPEIYDLLED